MKEADKKSDRSAGKEPYDGADAGELDRIYNMQEYERYYAKHKYICGVDEAGRGPLAGPVVAAAVILPKDAVIIGLDDSKKLTDKKRRSLYDEIRRTAVSYGIGMADEGLIDEINILQATYEAMRRAISALGTVPDILLNDAVVIPGIDIEQVSIIKGDQKSLSIAAASVLAKVTRDDYMLELARLYPNYGFDRHKGYGTRLHYEAIEKYGIVPAHRRTFLKKILQ